MPILKFIGVGVGSNDLEELTKNLIEVKEAIFHPKFEKGYLLTRHDLAILKLKTPLNLSDTVQPACLDTKKVELYNDWLRFAGIN